MRPFLTLLFAALFAPFVLNSQTAGSLDSTFNLTGIIDQKVNDQDTRFFRVSLQPDQKSVCFGYVQVDTFTTRIAAMRFNLDGTPDASFGVNGVAATPNIDAFGCDGHILPDGKILIVAVHVYAASLRLVQLLPNGALDPDFGNNGVKTVNIGSLIVDFVDKSIIQPDGKILVIGRVFNFDPSAPPASFVARILPNGNLDPTYGSNGFIQITTPAGTPGIRIYGGGMQPDAKLILTGRIGDTTLEHKWYLQRLTKDGGPDPTFGNNGEVIQNLGPSFSEVAFDALVLPDGKIIAGGLAQKAPGYHFTLVRFLPDGTVDNSFGLGGKAQVSMDCCYSVIYGLALQTDGKILACGYASDDGEDFRLAVARFKANGILDQTFGTGGKVIVELEPDSVSQRAVTMAIQTDEKILLAGYTDYNNNTITGLLIRLNPGTVVGTDEAETDVLTDLAAAPNPVTGTSFRLSYSLLESTPLTLTLHDVSGRHLAILLDAARRPAGENTETLELPGQLSPGLYFLQLKTAAGTKTLKLITE